MNLLFQGDLLPEALAAGSVARIYPEAFENSARGTLIRGPGVISIDGSMAVVLPRCFRKFQGDTNRIYQGLGATIRSLSRYLRMWVDRSAVLRPGMKLDFATCGVDGSGDLLDRIESAYALVEDYRANGRVIVTRQQSGSNFRGRIHWNRTINRTRPVFDCGDVLYLEPIEVRTSIDQEHPFSMLHLATVAHACEWLGVDSPDTGGVVAADPGHFDWLGARNVLERTDHQLFQDRHKQVARWLHRYLDAGARSTSGAATDTAGLFAKSFEWVWEDMLKVALGPASDTVDTGRLQGSYRLIGGTSARGVNLKPDLLIEECGPDGNILFVIDAKDYEPDVSLPATESLAKQFLYRYLLSGEMGGSGLPLNRIGNAFVMPGVVDCPTGVRLLGVHDLADEEYGAYPFGRIVVLEADFNRVAAAYWNRRPDCALRLELTRIIRMAMERGFRAFNQEVTD